MSGGTRSILAADIGGTSSRFAAFTVATGGALALRARSRLSTRAAGSFGELLSALRAAGFPLAPQEADVAVIAVPGPVIDGTRCAPPFVDWRIDFSRATADYGFRRWVLVNDFVAMAHAARSAAAAAALPILAGRAVPGAAVAVVGAGTGFGQALLVPDGRGGHLAAPSEGGHADFPLAGAEEGALGAFLRRELRVERVTTAMLVSGSGIANIHWHLTGRRIAPEDVPGLLCAGSPTLALGARFYARACRLAVLHGAAFGGLFVAGGVAARTPALLTHPAFEREFRAPGAMAERLAEVPVCLLADEESGLWGAAEIGRALLAPQPSAAGAGGA